MNQYQIKFKAGNSSIITMNVKSDSFIGVIEKVEENFPITEIKSIKLDIPHVEKSGDLFNQPAPEIPGQKQVPSPDVPKSNLKK